MRALSRLSFMTALVLTLVGGRSGAQDASALRARLQATAEKTSLKDPKLMPWHLRMEVQLFDKKGKPSEAGTVEMWWTHPDVARIDFKFPSYTGTETSTAEGAFRSRGSGAPPEMAFTLLHQITDPLPNSDELKASTPELMQESFGNDPYDCIMLSQPMENVASAPPGLFPTYCFERARDVFADSFEYGAELTMRTRVGNFQGKTVPLALNVTLNNIERASAQITSLQGRPTPYP